MAWYDWFAHVYDSSLEGLYRPHRAMAADALSLTNGARVLDVPCGTGQGLGLLSARAGDGGLVVAVDTSAGMLRQAQARLARDQLDNVRLVQGSAAGLQEVDGQFDALHVFLGMSVFDDMPATFAHLWSRLRPGGRCVLVDVHAERLGVQGRLVNWIARADIRRRFWEPLEACATGFSLCDLPYRRQHGGQIMLAVGDKPSP